MKPAPLPKDSAVTICRELFTLAKLLLPGLAHPQLEIPAAQEALNALPCWVPERRKELLFLPPHYAAAAVISLKLHFSTRQQSRERRKVLSSTVAVLQAAVSTAVPSLCQPPEMPNRACTCPGVHGPVLLPRLAFEQKMSCKKHQGEVFLLPPSQENAILWDGIWK